jgi:hypothetical protein
MDLLFFSVSQYTSDVIVVPCCMNSTITTPFLSRNTVSISFPTDNLRLKFFGLVGEFVCIRCFGCSLVSAFTNETQVSSPVTPTMWLRNSSPSLLYHSQRSKPKPFSALCAHPWVFLEPILRKTCASLACDNLVYVLFIYFYLLKQQCCCYCCLYLFLPLGA